MSSNEKHGITAKPNDLPRGSDDDSNDNGGLKVALPNWAARAIQKLIDQGPLVMVLVAMLWIFRIDGLDTIAKFQAQSTDQRKDYLAALDKIELANKERTERLIATREKEVDRMIQSFDRLAESLRKKMP